MRPRPGPARWSCSAVAAGRASPTDLVSKTIVVATLSHRQPVRLLGGLLTLRGCATAAPRSASGTVGMTVVFTLIAVGVIISILRTSRRLRSLPWAVTLGLLLGGAAGNLGDRLFRSPGPFRGVRRGLDPAAALAGLQRGRLAIVCGGFLAVLLAARGIRLDGTRDRPAEPGAARDSRNGPATGRGSGAGRDAVRDRQPGPAAGRQQPRDQPVQRRVPVPEGLDGERLDAALARMFGLSRATRRGADQRAARCSSAGGPRPSPTGCPPGSGSM